MRQALTLLLEQEPDIEIVGQAADGEEAIRQALVLGPDVMLMDISMPRVSGIEATRRIIQAAQVFELSGSRCTTTSRSSRR